MSDEQFLARFPCYVIVAPPFKVDDQGQMVVDEDIHVFVSYAGSSNSVAVMAFSEDDYAENYARQNKPDGVKLAVLQISTPERMSRLLLLLKSATGDELDVCFDRTPSFQGWHVAHRDIVAPP